jgi:hypothetical protein
VPINHRGEDSWWEDRSTSEEFPHLFGHYTENIRPRLTLLAVGVLELMPNPEELHLLLDEPWGNRYLVLQATSS